jgi:NTE family protein
MSMLRERRIAVVFSGGVGLGAYQAGAYAALEREAVSRVDWIAASSVGAANGAIVAGSAPGARLERLRELWMLDTATSQAGLAAESMDAGAPWRHAQNWARAMQTRLLGAPGHFHPRFSMSPAERFRSFYDLAPLRERLCKLVDFGRLNSGEIRFAVATTDLESGDTVVFDTAKGARIEVDHLLASAGYLPEFAPVEIDGRLLGDGGLSANAPIEAVLLEPDLHAEERVCFVIDLFARDGERPVGLETALARKNDLMFANQTFKRLELVQRELDLKERLARCTTAAAAPVEQGTECITSERSRTRHILYLSYRAPAAEAGPEKPFDLSRQTANDRWRTGELDMAYAIAELARPTPTQPQACALTVVRRRPNGSSPNA